MAQSATPLKTAKKKRKKVARRPQRMKLVFQMGTPAKCPNCHYRFVVPE